MAADEEVSEAAVEDTEVNSAVDEAVEVDLEEGAVEETMPKCAPVPQKKTHVTSPSLLVLLQHRGHGIS